MLAAQVQQAQAQQQHQLSTARPRTNSQHAQLQQHLLPSRPLPPLQPLPMPGAGYGFVHPNSLLPHAVLIPPNLYGFNHPFSELTHPHQQVSFSPSGAFLSNNSTNSNNNHNLLPSSLTLHTRSPHPDSLPPLAVSRSHSAPSHILPSSPPPSAYSLHAPSAHNHMYAHRLAAGSDPNPSIHPPRSLSLSGPPVFPLPRPRTESSTSDRSRPISLHGVPQKPILNSTNVHHRLRTDSQNSRQSNPSHGFANGPSGLCVKPLNSQNDPVYAFHHSPRSSRSPTPTTHSAPSTPPPSQTQTQTRPSSPSTHPLTLAPNQAIGTMTRRPSPLAQTTSHDSDSDHRKSASYRNSSASTINANPGSSNISPPTFGPDRRDEDDDDDSEAASDPDHRQPGHRSTPGTSVDSTTSNNAQSLGNPSLATRPVPSTTTPLLDPTTHKHSKLNLSNKLRRALSIGVLHESMIQSSIPELGPTNSNERLKSSSASVAGVRLSPATPPISKSGAQATSGRRFGFMNPKANSSTDNLSISSTVSSASVMIRKLGNLGKTARRNSVMGLTKMFKDKKEGAGLGEEDKSAEDKLDRPRRSAAQHQKNSPSTSVAQVTAEVDRSLSIEFPGMTPAAAFIHKQKQQYAQQEAAARAAAAASPPTTASTAAGSGPAASDSVKSKSKPGAGHNLSQSLGGGSGAPTSATEARKKMIEKEKEKLKSKKTRKWGFGSSSSSSATETEAAAPVSSSEHTQRPSVDGSEGDDSEEWDDRTVRGAAIEAAIASESGGSRDLVEELGTGDEQDMMDEYDVESLFGNGSNDGGSGGQSQLKVRPPKEAVPKKGILKNAQNFSQDEYLPGASSHSKPGSVNATADSPKPTTPKSEADKSTLASSTSGPSTGFMLELGGESPNLALGFSTYGKERRATFAQHLSVHSTWPPAIYDRRGEPATCNRLTPTLAQRIKEELNAFKMEEMEVHVASRIHTHFFV